MKIPTRWCSRCKSDQPLDLFRHRVKNGARRPYGYCKPCTKDYQRNWELSTKYGIDKDTYDRMLVTQGGRCLICRREPRRWSLSVDHDHRTGKIRGLLCSFCNYKIIGTAGDDPALLRRAADYLDGKL